MKKDKANIITDKFIAKYFDIDKEEAIKIHKRLERIVYGNDETIVRIGDEADGLYFIDEGQATVINNDGEAVNEMVAGQYFGEYAILANEPRLTTVKAHGKVVAYRMSSKDFLDIVGKHPQVSGRLLKQLYGQITSKHTKLVSLTRQYRGVMSMPDTHKDNKLKDIILTYGITALVFVITCIFAVSMKTNPVWWQLLPLVFLMGFTLRTKRVVEGMLLTVMLLGGMLYRGNFVRGFGDIMIEGIGNADTASTIMIMAMVEAMAALLAAAGVASAFKKLAKKHMKTKSGSMLGMLLILIAVCIDECLNVITAGFCLNESLDKHKVPRESRALMGSFSLAICSLIPFSLWGAYISAWVDTYMHKGGNVFLKTIPYNLVGIVAVIAAILLCLDVLPKTRQIKDAYKRVDDGGKMWPENSEKYMDLESSDEVVGRPINLILPMIIWIISSITCGMLRNPGEFAMDAVSGLIITLISMFVLYVGQRLMTPKAFFEIFADGISNSLMPILLLIFAERIAACFEVLEVDVLLEKAIPSLVGGNLALVPAVLFVICTLICISLGSCWGMYGIGIPVALIVSGRLGLNIPLCLGAALAAGVIGEKLCPYIDNTAPEVTVIGCEPKAYRKIRMQYWIPIAIICVIGYILMGICLG